MLSSLTLWRASENRCLLASADEQIFSGSVGVFLGIVNVSDLKYRVTLSWYIDSDLQKLGQTHFSLWLYPGMRKPFKLLVRVSFRFFFLLGAQDRLNSFSHLRSRVPVKVFLQHLLPPLLIEGPFILQMLKFLLFSLGPGQPVLQSTLKMGKIKILKKKFFFSYFFTQ